MNAQRARTAAKKRNWITMFLIGFALTALSSITPLVAQELEDDFQNRVAATRKKTTILRYLTAGTVRDHKTGEPIQNAYVGNDIWCEGAYGESISMNPYGTQDRPSHTDSHGRFVKLTSYGRSGNVRVLVDAPGYMPTRAVAGKRVHGFDGWVGYGFDIEMRQCLQIHAQFVGTNGAPMVRHKLSWLLLNRNEPCMTKSITTDDQGRAQIELKYFHSPDGLALHVWDETTSTRIVLDESEVDETHINGTFVLRKTPTLVTFAINSPQKNLQKENIWFKSIFCVNTPYNSMSFRITAVSLGPTPGAPSFQIWDGKKGTLTASLPPGKIGAVFRLGPDTNEFRTFDARRGRLDMGPDFGRWHGLVNESGDLDLEFEKATKRWKLQDDTDLIESRKDWPFKHTELKEPELGDLKESSSVTLTSELVSDIENVRVFFIKDGMVYRKKIFGMRKGKLRVPKKLIDNCTFAVLTWNRPSNSKTPNPIAFAKGDILVQFDSTAGKNVINLTPAPRVRRLTFTCRDASGQPVPNVILWHRGSRFGPARTWRRNTMPAGVAPWGLALEATSGLPHFSMMTDSNGQVHLRDVPLGDWTLELISNNKSLGLRRITVAEHTTHIELSTPP